MHQLLRPRLGYGAAAFLLIGTLILAACGGSAGDPTPAEGSDTPATATVETTTPEESTDPATATPDATEEATDEADETDEATETPTAEAESDENTGDGDGKRVDLSYLDATWDKVNSYRIQVKMKAPEIGEDGQDMVVEVIKPNKYRMAFMQDGMSIEMIAIDDKTWMKMGDSWMELPGQQGMNEFMPFEPEESLDDVTAPDATVVEVGTETIDGVDCRVYEVTAEVEGEQVTSKIWVGKDDQLPRKMVSAMGDFSMELLFSGYNGDFDIQPPM